MEIICSYLQKNTVFHTILLMPGGKMMLKMIIISKSLYYEYCINYCWWLW